MQDSAYWPKWTADYFLSMTLLGWFTGLIVAFVV